MTITKSGELTSFYTVNKAPIKHLRVYFSPKQAGEGDPSPENIRPIEGWDRIILNSVPEEYQELEYIESPGTQSSTTKGAYIDTQIIPYLGLCSKMVYQAKADGYAYGSIYTAMTDYYGWNTATSTTGRIMPYLGSGNYPSLYDHHMNDFHELKIEYKKFYLDDVLLYDYTISSNTYSFTNATSIYIGALHSKTSIRTPGYFKTAYFWDYETNNMIGIFIPCYRKLDNKVGMYDVITKKFFYSQGDVDFIAGPTILQSQRIMVDWSNDIGTIYGGYVDLITGELWKTHHMIELDNINYHFETVGTSFHHIRPLNYPAPIMNNNDVIQGTGNLQSFGKYFFYANHNSKSIFTNSAKLNNKGFNSLEELTTFLTAYPQKMTYEMATPQLLITLTPSQLQTFIGRNNIWSNADRVEIEYDLAESNDELYRRRNIILQGAPHLETATDNIINFNTNMAASLKECKIYFSPVQEGEGDPSPDNVRPITGWSDLKFHKTEKSIVQFIKDSITSSGFYNGYAGWCNEKPIDELPLNKQVTYSAYIDCTNKESVAHECQVKVWAHKKSGGYTILVGNKILAGSSGISTTTFTIYDAYDWIGFGLSLDIGVTASNPMVEYGSIATEYEPYNGTTISVTFPTLGKNLLNPATLEQGGIAWTGNDFIASNRVRTGFIPVEAGKKYTASATGFIAFMHFYDAEKGNIGENVGGVNITAPEGAKFVRCGFRKSDDVDIVPSDITDSQLEEGSTATSYEPYTNTIYGGYIDLTKGKIIQTHKSIIFNGSESDWNTYKASDQIHFHRTIVDKKVGIGTSISSIFPNVKNIYFWDTKVYSQYGDHQSLNRIYVNAPYEMPNGVSEWREWLSNNPMQLVYELATPIEYDIDPITLKTLRGTNNIWSNANGPVSITYWTH